jgi:ABC-2 type transport system ATP-binding protein
MSVLSIQALHKTYGKITAVNQLSLRIEAGSVFGLLGPNGSGKTTTLGMILGVTIPTSGSFQWFGEKPTHLHRKRIGAILEKPNFYPTFSAAKNLEVVAKIKEVPKKRIDEVLDQVGLLSRKDDPFRTYSLGMKQRLAIGSALLADPEVLILDEPTNGLDPKGIAEIRELIRAIALSGKTIILASHLLDEVQKVCSEFAILKTGNLIHSGKVEVSFGDFSLFHIGAEDMEGLVAAVKLFPAYLSHEMLEEKLQVKCEAGTQAAQLNQFLAQSGVYLNQLISLKKNLEQQFMEILSQHA